MKARFELQMDAPLKEAALAMAKAEGSSLAEAIRGLLKAWLDAKVVAYGGHKDE